MQPHRLMGHFTFESSEGRNSPKN